MQARLPGRSRHHTGRRPHAFARTDGSTMLAVFFSNMRFPFDFSDVQSKPRQSKAAVSAATSELVKLFDQLDEVLHKQLDPLSEKFKTSEPVFYNEYKTARSIVDSTATHDGSTNTNVVSVAASTAGSGSTSVPRAA